jgi:hypothetical protein
MSISIILGFFLHADAMHTVKAFYEKKAYLNAQSLPQIHT